MLCLAQARRSRHTRAHQMALVTPGEVESLVCERQQRRACVCSAPRPSSPAIAQAPGESILPDQLDGRLDCALFPGTKGVLYGCT